MKEATSHKFKIFKEKGNVKVRMTSGDNIMTVICVARKSSLISTNGIVYLVVKLKKKKRIKKKIN